MTHQVDTIVVGAGVAGWINPFGIESPGFTVSPAIAEPGAALLDD